LTDLSGAVVGLKIRRSAYAEGDGFPKFVAVKGSRRPPQVAGDVASLPAVIVESEMDAMLVHQECSDIASAVALAGIGGKPKLPDALAGAMAACPLVIVSMDADPPGVAAARWWMQRFRGKALFWPAAGEAKDVGEMAALGAVSVRGWIRAALMVAREKLNIDITSRSAMRIVVDSREQLPFTFEGSRYAGTLIEVGTLAVGDYSLKGLGDKVTPSPRITGSHVDRTSTDPTEPTHGNILSPADKESSTSARAHTSPAVTQPHAPDGILTPPLPLTDDARNRLAEYIRCTRRDFPPDALTPNGQVRRNGWLAWCLQGGDLWWFWWWDVGNNKGATGQCFGPWAGHKEQRAVGKVVGPLFDAAFEEKPT
jgi:hypothetical protein